VRNWSRRVDGVDPPLVEVDEEDDIITEAREAVHCGHRDDECENVVNEGVEEAVDKEFPGQVLDAL
jgi:hypothetical protein